MKILARGDIGRRGGELGDDPFVCQMYQPRREKMNQALIKSADEKFCKDCGSVISAKAEICPKCGVRQLPIPNSLTSTAPNGKSKLAAALFALFLGGIGIHKFYLGQVGWGIAYLIFCWTFIPAMIAFVEAILLFVMSEEKFNQKFG